MPRLLPAILSVGCGVIAAWALLRLRPRLRGTTWVAPWYWSICSLCFLAASEAIVLASSNGSIPAWAEPLRAAARAMTFCPIVAVLGAKRPQNRGWQFVVLTLWIVLALPSVRWWAMGEGPVESHAALRLLSWLLAAVTAANYLATRSWLPATLYCAGQSLLMTDTPIVADAASVALPRSNIALLLFMMTWLLVAAARPRTRLASGLDRCWLDFRDMFGTVWALRVAERFNATAQLNGWPARLEWNGFATAEDQVPAELRQRIDESFRALLRRFVSPEWIAHRMPKCDDG